jgi:2-polyprenyl-6-methoxyphenol hydroxylase-like FAD-dependent oxidoreductase
MPPNVNVHFGCRVTSVENVGNKARLTYTSRSKATAGDDVVTTNDSMDADVIVGADGVKSVIRTALELPSPPHAYPSLKQDDAPAALPPASYRYTGTYCYRGLIPMDLAKSIDVGTDEENTAAKPRMWFGPGKHILIFPIDQGTVSTPWVMLGRKRPKPGTLTTTVVIKTPDLQRRRLCQRPLVTERSTQV